MPEYQNISLLFLYMAAEEVYTFLFVIIAAIKGQLRLPSS